MESESQASQERYQRFAMAMRGFMFTVLLVDGQPQRTIYHHGSQQITGYDEAEHQANPLLWPGMIVEEDRPAVTEQIDAILNGGTTRSVEHRIRHKNGSIRWVRNVSAPILDEQGRLTAYDGLITDITELKVAQTQSEELLEQLRRMSLRDSLTGLLNRRGFEAEFNRAWQLGLRHKLPTGLLIMDLDHFKVLNDTYGHPIGDQVLLEAAGLIATAIRASDIACRYGGDEIVVILPLTDSEETRCVAERLRNSFQQHVFCREVHDLRTTVSIGAASVLGGELSEQRILMLADRALYRAKQSGRNRLCFWEPDAGSTCGGSANLPSVRAVAEVAQPANGSGQGRIMIVDDEPAICRLIAEILRRAGYSFVVAANGSEARQIAGRELGSIDVVLMDIQLGDSNGIEVLKELRQADDTLVGIIVTGCADVGNVTEALRSGVLDFLTKPFSQDKLLEVLVRAMHYRRLILENRRYQRHLEDMVAERSAALTRALIEVRQSYRATMDMLVYILETREHKTGEHCKRVVLMAQILAREMGLGDEEVELVGQGALMHDIGKVAIPDQILLKQAPLTEEEWKIMKSHPRLGYEIVRPCPALEMASEIVYSHQEHYDGSGYPRGLKGAAICLGARIFAVIDAYDAIRSDRPYAPSRSAEAAVAEIVRTRGQQFDPEVVDAFLRCQPRIEACITREPQVAGWSPPFLAVLGPPPFP